jgi:hypothetical protein
MRCPLVCHVDAQIDGLEDAVARFDHEEQIQAQGQQHAVTPSIRAVFDAY